MKVDALAKLHTSLVDTIRGYDEAIKDVEREDLRRLFQHARDMHSAHHRALHGALEAAGAKADDAGSFMTVVHTAVIKVRGAVTGLEGALSAFASGEEQIVGEYDDAIGEADGATRAMLVDQKGEVLREIGALKAAAA